VTYTSYDLNDDAAIFASNIQIQNGKYHFDWSNGSEKIENIELGLPGRHNVENAVAAILVARALDIPMAKIQEMLPGFKGVKRRFEKVYEDQSVVVIDDYAHHPTEIDAALKSLHALYPNKKLGVVFQPHLYSRTKDFALEFSQALNQADKLWLLDIYPARELPMAGVSSDLILNRVDISDKQIISKENLADSVSGSGCEVIAILGAGDIDRLVEPVTKAFSLKNKTVNA
jgi:UDP-N-acetylmuramate--alanine ligase